MTLEYRDLFRALVDIEADYIDRKGKEIKDNAELLEFQFEMLRKDSRMALERAKVYNSD
jgi:hypothetical protein